jgi:hypothetical protein
MRRRALNRRDARRVVCVAGDNFDPMIPFTKISRLAAVVSVLALVFVSCGDGSSTNTEPPTTVVDVTTTVTTTVTQRSSTTAGSEVASIRVTVGVDSGPDRIENVKLNQQVELTIVNPDADDEFHVHGYDLGGGATKAGEKKKFLFTATEAGDFEVESHMSETVLVVLRVS